MSTSNDEMYTGLLVTYLRGLTSDHWSYIDFLRLNRDNIVDYPPFTEDLNGLDGTWFRRFLRAVQDLKPTIYDTIKGKLVLKSTLDAEGLGLLNVASRLQSRKVTLDYEDQIAKLIPSSDKRSLDNTSADDKSTAKRVKIFNKVETLESTEQQLQNAGDYNTPPPPYNNTRMMSYISKIPIITGTDKWYSSQSRRYVKLDS
ncbi:9778_t:CDS:2 [Funneliformis geosporum]|uniref:9778_t:CDS:1 n=1 Tax=Funneliformis geosporum TaxID=1117311 RepID=A0A9W4T1T6_9GLOM|nr:9778_t:CDS:2 [Funneliformis geosporum]